MKNVLILALNKDVEFYEFTDEKNEFHDKFNNISEAVVKYLIYKLQKENRTLDYIFVFVKKENLEHGDYERFKNIFPLIPMDYIMISNGSVKVNLPLASEMADKVIEYKNSITEDINITVNLTDDFEYNSLLASLLQLLQYNGVKIDSTLYANTKNFPHIIEEVSDFINLPALIKGAEDFITGGNTDKIQEFFSDKEPSDHTKNLMEKMTGLSETLRVCGNYEAAERAMKKLADAIKIYEKSLDEKLNNLLNKTNNLSAKLKKCTNAEEAEEILKKLETALSEYKKEAGKKEVTDINEYYFSKLLPKIKYEYSDILPTENKKTTPIDIIRRTLKMGLIQQAVVFFTEWIPEFLIKENYIVVDKSIEEECIKKGVNFSSWTVHFFRAYQMKIIPKSITYEEAKKIFDENKNNLQGIIDAVRGKNKKLDEFLKNIQGFSKSVGKNPVEKLLALSKKHFLHRMIEATQNKSLSFEAYVKTKFTNPKSMETDLTRHLINMGEEDFKNLFDLKEETEKDKAFKENAGRAEIMEYLINNNLLKLNMPRDKFLNLTDNYELIVQYFRNKMAHADITNNVVVKQDKFIKIMEKSLDLINKK